MRRTAGNPVARRAVAGPEGIAAGPQAAVTGPERAVVAPEGLVDVRLCPGDSRPW